MPVVQANEIEIYYEEHGSGEPLLLIMGWGGNAATWDPQLEGLAERYRVIAFDNRGAGRTKAPDGPYTISQMAADTAGLLHALGVPKAHVFGVSMGGMVAQELALDYPDLVGALILGCTSPGGSNATGKERLQEDIEAVRTTNGTDMAEPEWFSEFLKRLWTEEALAKSASQLQDFVLSLIRFPPSTRGLHWQIDAVSVHDTYDRLPLIGQPTLVITGGEDSLIDPGNADILAERIPGAELRVFPGLKHAFHLEQPDKVNSVIIDFIGRASASINEIPAEAAS